MGLEVTATHVIWAFAAVIVVGGATTAFFDSAEGLAEASASRDTQFRERIAARVEGSIFCYDGASQRVNLTAYNGGSTRLVPSEATVVLDGVARTATASIPGATGTDLWSPREVAYFTVTGVAVEPTRLMLVTGEGAAIHATKVECPYLASIVVTPASATLTAGQTQDFVAQGFDQHGAPFDGVTFSWSTEAGTIASLNDTAARLSATVAGSNLAVTAHSGAITGRANVTVHPAAPASVTVAPQTSQVQAGATQGFVATVRDAYGNINATAPVSWSTNAGSITQAGLLTAQTSTATGRTVTATSGGASGLATVDIIPGPVASVSISPTAATLNTTQTRQFAASAVDAYGNAVPNATFTWSTTRGGVTSSGFYTAPTTVGTATVTATSNGNSATANLTIIRTIHITAIQTYRDGVPTSSFNRGETVETRVTIVDQNGFAVSGASVAIRIQEPDGSVRLANGTATTNASGISSYSYKLPNGKIPGTWTISVLNVWGPSLAYAPAENVVTSRTFQEL